eukprot:TRINITY_DN21987_c0_g1_i1.p1 TRINITY_DN21987_c0_g1~~TRINITY_DN21987_c0_g1_i1.p1  ORF type:complete len:858 (+),score=224.55 TRINITY_DN21987_c0_g1_i1:51-2624(+)
MSSLAVQNHETPLDAVAKNLKSERPNLRCGALRELGRLGKRMSRQDIDQTIVPAISDPDASVQEHALVALGELGVRGAEYAQLVTAKLQKPSAKQVTRAALTTLGDMGPSAGACASDVVPFLNHQDLDLVVDACTALGKMKASSAAEQLSSKLTSTDSDVVFAACMALSAMDCQSQEIGRLLTRDDARARAAAVNALKTMSGAAEFLSDVAPLLGDSDSYVRLGAADLACRLGSRAVSLAVPAGKLLSSQDPGVAAAAASALGGIGEAAASQIPGLEQALRNTGEDTTALPLTVAGISPKLAAVLRKPACAAATALAAMGSAGARSAPRIAECLNSKDWEVRTAGLHALSRMASSSARYVYSIVDCLRDEAPPVAAAACLALGEIAAATGSPSASTARAVSELLEHPHPTVRARAVQGLGMMGDEAHVHVERFVALFGDRAWNVQAEAVRAVAKCGELGQMFAPDVARMTYEGARPEVQVAACDALARMGERGASFKDEVNVLLDSPEEAVRIAAQRSLDIFGGDRSALTSLSQPAIEAHADVPVEKLPVGLLFPGQGSQYVKMLSEVKDLPPVKSMLAKAREVLGYDILEICLQGPDTKLEQTKYCQPAVYIAGLAGLELLKKEQPAVAEQAQAVAGLSLGEYTALTVAGLFDFETGLELVKLRAEAMQEAAEMSPQRMLSVAGLDQATLEKLCEESRSGPKDVCQVANFLFPNGFSCSGSQAAVEKLHQKATATSGCLQCRILATSGAFHTPLMAPAREKLLAALRQAEVRMKPIERDIYMNVHGKKLPAGTPPAEVLALLGDQLTGCVLWEPSMKAMLADNITQFYECGPGKQLKAMMKRINADAWKQTTNIAV